MALLIPPDVLEQLAGLPKADRKRVLETLQAVAADPGFRWPFVTEMVGSPGVWRLRKGDWRAVYRLVEALVPPGEEAGKPASAAEGAEVANPPDVLPGDAPRAVHPDVVVIWVGHRREAYR